MGIEVHTPGGVLRGSVADGVERFLGIPYAQPPVGTLRFRAPEPAAPWTGVREATAPGPICPQVRDEMDRMLGASDQPQSEAGCLTVNVWRPEGTRVGDDLPVLVWIHGGALVGGASSWEQYSGASFARDGIVFVGVNYRLHSLGFLDLAAHFADMPDAVNLGLRDVALALRWVRDGIRSFGGDPARVTIFGESAGGGLTSALLGYLPAAGLFHRAIIQSGTAAVLHDRDASAAIGANALRAWGVRPGDRAALERVPVDRMLAVTDAELMSGVEGAASFPWILTRDVDGLDLDAVDAVSAGRADGVDLILGWTVDEYRLRWLVQQPDGPAVPIERISEAGRAAAREVYGERMPGAGAAEIEEKIVNDQHFLAPALAIGRRHADRGGRARLYEFRWRSPILDGRVGACHALELPFVFDLDVAPEFHGPQLPRPLVDAMHGAWIAFAAGEEPRVDGREWPVVGEDRLPIAVFDTTSSVEPDVDRAVSDLWLAAEPWTIGIA